MSTSTRKLSRAQIWSTYLGNFFEHYDTALFGFLSPFLAPLIFPHENPITALILTYAIIPLGMIARPFGALIFGYIGDTFGRRQALFLTLSGMALVSGCIAFTPTYDQVGILAPLLFSWGRILQNFLSSGETMGGAIYLLENSPEKRHDLLSGLYNATTVGGILFASAGVAVLGHYQAIDWGWRVLYLLGCVTALSAFIIRYTTFNDEIDAPKYKIPESLSNLLKIFWTYRIQLLMIAINAGFSYACYVIALVLTNGLIPLISSVSKEEMMSLNTVLLLFDFCTLPLFGWLASKTSREKVMLAAALGVALTGIPLFMLLPHASLIEIIGIRACFVVFGVAFSAPFHSWALQITPPAYRYLLVSFGYALGSQVLGGPTAALSLWAFQKTGSVASVGMYWFALALASSLTIPLSLKLKKKMQIVAQELA